MSGFQLVASLVSSLAWPLIVMTVLIFIWLKRSAIAEFVNSRSISQGRALKRLRAGPVELEWDQLIESTAKQVSEVSPEPSPIVEGTVRKELEVVASSVPAAAVLEAFARVERRLRELVRDMRSQWTSKRPAVPWMARAAYERGLISEEISSAIYNLSRLRNEAAHRVGEADITEDQAGEYLDLVDRVLDAIDRPDGKDRHGT